VRRKGLSTLLLLVAWGIWNERNARVFKNYASMPSIVIAAIKRHAYLWVATGAKRLSAIMSREYAFVP
jgi:cytochrome b